MTDKTLIWDFNGTIIDDLDLCLGIENLMLKERNMKYPYTCSVFRQSITMSVQAIRLRMKPMIRFRKNLQPATALDSHPVT